MKITSWELGVFCQRDESLFKLLAEKQRRWTNSQINWVSKHQMREKRVRAAKAESLRVKDGFDLPFSLGLPLSDRTIQSPNQI